MNENYDKDLLNNKSVLVTGGTGSFGKTFINSVLKKYKPDIFLSVHKKHFKALNLSEKNLFRLKKLNIHKKIILKKGSAVNIGFVNKIIKKNHNIKEIYYLAGDSSVTNSFLHPDVSLKTNVLGVLNILISIKKINKSIKMFNASSGQFFGNQISPQGDTKNIPPEAEDFS